MPPTGPHDDYDDAIVSLVFLAIFLLMIGGDALWALAARRAFAGHARRWPRRACLGFAATMVIGLMFMLFGRMIGHLPDAWIPQALLIALFLWHFIGLPIALLATVIRCSPQIASRFFRGRAAAEIESASAVSRRAFLAQAAAVTPILFTGTASVVASASLSEFRIRRLVVPIRNLPSAIDGLTIAHVSDTHLGRFTTADTFRKIVAATNDLDADLVLQTGDLINHDQRDLPVAAEMVRAVRGRHGQFLCEGNHDLIEGRERFEAFMRDAKLPILIDEIATVRINGVDVELLGLPWLRTTRGESLDAAHASAVAALAGRRSASAFPILLAHHPHAFDAARLAGLPLTLSGHTHGGQVNLALRFGFGPLVYRYWSGLYERDGSSCVVSNGAGNWFPLRINAPAEILHLTLKAG